MEAYLPNASIIIDKYHFIRYVTWAIEKIRKRLNLNENVFSR
nr:transposase [Herbinix luporum]